MIYRVEWVPSALDDLTEIWLQAGAQQRTGVTAATDEIDHRLRRDPSGEGESRDQGRRILLIPPLGVTYSITEDDRLVRVLNVWQFSTPTT